MKFVQRFPVILKRRNVRRGEVCACLIGFEWLVALRTAGCGRRAECHNIVTSQLDSKTRAKGSKVYIDYIATRRHPPRI